MTIAIHQPNYFPWIGYFYKVNASDTFVFLEDVPFSKGSYTNRCSVRMSGDAQPDPRWLTVPLQKFETGTLVSGISVATNEDWFEKHMSVVNAYYRDAPYVSDVMALLREAAGTVKTAIQLGEVNANLIKLISNYLGLTANWVNSSDLSITSAGEQRVVEIVNTLGGKTYLSGKGASNYQSGKAFEEAGIELVYYDMSRWLENKSDEADVSFGTHSIIDTLCLIGRDGVTELFREFDKSGLSNLQHNEIIA